MLEKETYDRMFCYYNDKTGEVIYSRLVGDFSEVVKNPDQWREITEKDLDYLLTNVSGLSYRLD
jgi:hypothetical protein